MPHHTHSTTEAGPWLKHCLVGEGRVYWGGPCSLARHLAWKRRIQKENTEMRGWKWLPGVPKSSSAQLSHGRMSAWHLRLPCLLSRPPSELTVRVLETSPKAYPTWSLVRRLQLCLSLLSQDRWSKVTITCSLARVGRRDQATSVSQLINMGTAGGQRAVCPFSVLLPGV